MKSLRKMNFEEVGGSGKWRIASRQWLIFYSIRLRAITLPEGFGFFFPTEAAKPIRSFVWAIRVAVCSIWEIVDYFLTDLYIWAEFDAFKMNRMSRSRQGAGNYKGLRIRRTSERFKEIADLTGKSIKRRRRGWKSVSYTHLTLPTIYSV